MKKNIVDDVACVIMSFTSWFYLAENDEVILLGSPLTIVISSFLKHIYICIYIYIYIHTHTHTYIYIYIFA